MRILSALGPLLLVAMLTACGSEPAQQAANPDPAANPAPSDPEAAIDAATVHADVLVLDAHADIELPDAPTRYAGPDGRSRVEPDKMRAGGVDAVVLAIAVGPGPRTPEGHAEALARAELELAAVQALVADPAEDSVLATTSGEVRAAHDAGSRAIILGFQNARILGDDPQEIDRWHAAGVRVFALTHMGHNDYADSSRPIFLGESGDWEPDAEHGGLSDLGRAAVDRINALGAVVDVSQLSRQAVLEVLERTRAPIIASHSNVQALTNVRRNLSDEEIDAIGRNGGVIHLAAFGGYLFDSNDPQVDADIVEARRAAGLPDKYDYPFELYWEIEDEAVQMTYIGRIREILGPGNVEVLLDHLDYVVERIGIDHVGFGHDFNHGGGMAGFEDATGAAIITEGLVRRGYDAEQIARIWGGNFLRVMQAAADAADTPAS